MKVLVDTQSGNVQGIYNSPLGFSISGKYVINIPASAGPVPIDINPSTVITSKVSALSALYPLMSQALNDEFLDISMIDPLLSSKLVTAPNKGTTLLPGGYLMTSILTITVPTLNRIALLYFGSLLNRDVKQVLTQPDPASLLYEWDPGSSSFVEFGSGIFQVDMMDSTGTIVLIPNLDSGKEYLYPDITPLGVRLRFTSLAAIPWRISDYLLLAGG